MSPEIVVANPAEDPNLLTATTFCENCESESRLTLLEPEPPMRIENTNATPLGFRGFLIMILV